MVAAPEGMFMVSQAFPFCNRRTGAWRILAPCPGRRVRAGGALPRAVPPSVYAEMIAALRRAGVPAVLDAAGTPLALGLEAGPALIKPNSQECGEILGAVPRTPGEFQAACRTLLEKAECVLISDGPGGCWFAAREDGGRIFHGSAPQVDVMDTTAAGDALLAEFCHWHFPGRRLDEHAIRHACAAAAGHRCPAPPAGPDARRRARGQSRVTRFEGNLTFET